MDRVCFVSSFFAYLWHLCDFMNYSFGRIKARSLFCYLPDSCPFLQNIDNFSVYLSVIMKNQTIEMYDDER